MNRFLEELPIIIITIVLLTLIGVLLALHVVNVDSPLVGIIAAVIVPFWFLNAAFKWQAPGTTTPTPTPAPVAQPAPTPVPQFTTMVPQPPVQTYMQPPAGTATINIAPIPSQFQQFGATLPYPAVPPGS